MIVEIISALCPVHANGTGPIALGDNVKFKTEAELRKALFRFFGVAMDEALRSDQSHEALRSKIHQALMQWPGRPGNDMSVPLTFPDRIIAYNWDEGGDTDVWEIPYTINEEDAVIFGQPVQVKEIRLFEPVQESASESRQKWAERVTQRLTLFGESKSDGARQIRAVGVTADVINGNGRRYSRGVLADALTRLNGRLNESAGQGRLILTGEAEHPSDKGGRPSILETVVKWEAASLDAGGQVLLEGTILPTSKGKDILALLEHGVPIDVSQRGYGQAKSVKENGKTIQEVTYLEITGYDLVAEGSDPNARLIESRQDDSSEEGEPMTLDELLKLLREQPELKESLMGKLGLADRKALAEKLGVDAQKLDEALKQHAEAAVELEERKRRDAIEAAIGEATKGLPYGEKLNGQFVEAVRKADPADAEAVKSIVESKREEWDGLMAAKALKAMGHAGVDVKGPVFEAETGVPEFARGAWELTESLRRSGFGGAAKLGDPTTPGERYAKALIARFDELNQGRLLAESKLLAEANQVSDLNLPYSVSRAIIAEAMPQLVAASVFDVGTTDQSPSRIYFETFAYESGATATVTDEAITSVDDTWVDLDYARITFGTVVVTSNDGNTTYTEGTDYVIDYAQGRIKVLGAGAVSNGTALKVDYGYLAIRKGEMQPIERGKMQLSYKTLEIAADRLATQISKESIVFSRSQLGYDIVGRNLTMLATKVRQRIDGDIFYRALAAVLSVANNSGGTWTSASDTLDSLVEKIGYAKVKVADRYYMPNAVLMSNTNADRLSNWDGFTAAGSRADATLDAAGYVGRIKGLPIFESTEWPDTYILVTNRQLVQHRVFQPIAVFGPYPTYDSSTGEMIAADQYYVEEFNGTDVPIDNKGAYVKVA